MSKFTRIAGTSIFVVAICVVILIVGSRPAAVATQPQQNDKLKEKLQRLKIQTFGGEAASLRANQLRKQHQGIARAMKDAEKLGLRQAFDKGTVILATDPEKTANPGSVVKANLFPSQLDLVRPISFRVSSPQDTFTDGAYEITFIPYDDGDPNTWEGIIYRAGPDIGEDTAYAVINIATQEPDVTQEIYYPPNGGDPEPVLLLSRQSQPGQPNSKETRIACNRLAGEEQSVKISLSTKVAMRTDARVPLCPQGQHVCLGAQAGECCSDRGLPGIRSWLKCSMKQCAWTGLICTRTGPLWGECWGTLCTGSMLLCLL